MYQRKLRIQKGFKDSIQLQFKNSDQKPISFQSTDKYHFDIIDTNGRQLVLTNPVEILDDSKIYSIKIDQPTASKTLAFTNTNEISIGQLVTGFGISANTVVIGIDNTATTVTLNNTPIYPISTLTSLTFATIAVRGIGRVSFEPYDTINLAAGNYKFIVKKENNEDPAHPSYTPAYANTYYGITGEIELVEDGFPIGYPIQTVDVKKLETGKEYDRNPMDMGYVFTTEWLRPMVRTTLTPTTSTAIITLSSFVGTITVEGTLDNNPSGAGHANAQAFTATTYTSVSPTQGTIQLDWNGAYTAVRFKVKPAQNGLGSNYYPTGYPVGSNTNKFPSGFVDQIQYIS